MMHPRSLRAALALGLVLGVVLMAAGASAQAPRVAPTSFFVALDQSNTTTEQENFTVSLEVANTTNISFVYFTFCQLSSPVCYSPVAMNATGGNWYSGTTNPMSTYDGMTVGVHAGYNITVLYDNGSTVTAPTVPNLFTNLTIAQSVSGEYMFEMTVAPTLYDLTGLVADAVTSVGIDGATVALVPGGLTTTTNATGAYAFTGILNGTYTLSVSAPGYETTNETVTIANANGVQNVPLYAGTGTAPPGTGGGGGGSPSLLGGLDAWLIAAAVVVIVALGALVAWTRRKGADHPSTNEPKGSSSGIGRKRAGWIAAIVVVVLVVGAGAAYADHLIPTAQSGSAAQTMAPSFTLATIYGENFSLTHYRNSSAVVIEFTSLSCSECQIVEKSLASLYSSYNQTGDTRVQFISIYIEPRFGDTVPALQTYHQSHNITWNMAQDTGSLAVSRSYGVQDIPTVVIIDPKGQVVYDVSGVQDQNTLQSTINSALAGTAVAISIVTVSVFALAAIAGVTTFFSPCAFPMFPGYMGLFLGLNSGQAAPGAANGGVYKGAARRAAVAGSVTALGMILVFLLVGLALILAASVVSGYIPDLLIAVGVVLIGLGALLLTNLQYWRIVTPLQTLWYRLGGKRPEENLSNPAATSGRGFHLKLFGYGMGYAAAAAGCVFPVIFSAIVAGLALGLLGGILNIVIFSATAALLMIVVTVMLALAGQKWVNQLKALTPVIKKVSAVALIVVGVYLIYFFYTAWIV
jgi:cytochrome c-type biogenesis protein